MYRIKTKCSAYRSLKNFRNCTTVKKPKAFSEIPGPHSIPIIGNVWRYLPIVGEYYKKSSGELEDEWKRRYGDIVVYKNFLGKPIYVLCYNKEDFETVFKNTGRYPQRGTFFALDPIYMYINNTFNVPKSIFFSQGKEWRDERVILNKQLYNSNISNDLLPQWNSLTDAVFENLNKKLQNDDNHNDYQISDYFTKALFNWLLDLATVVCYKQEYGISRGTEPDRHLKKSLEATMGILKTIETCEHPFHPFEYLSIAPKIFNIAILSMTLYRNINKFINIKNEEFRALSATEDDNYKQCLIEKLQNAAFAKCIITTLEEVYAALLGVGNITICLCLYCLATNPVEQNKVYEEIKSANLDQNEITMKHLHRLTALQNFIKETQRYFDVIFGRLYRVLDEDVILSGYHVPKGTTIQLNFTSVLKDSKYFPAPFNFNPDRWNDSSLESEVKYIFIPFGHGKRNCVGSFLARDIMTFMLYKLISNYSFEWLHGEMRLERNILTQIVSSYNLKITIRK